MSGLVYSYEVYLTITGTHLVLGYILIKCARWWDVKFLRGEQVTNSVKCAGSCLGDHPIGMWDLAIRQPLLGYCSLPSNYTNHSKRYKARLGRDRVRSGYYVASYAYEYDTSYARFI